MVWWWRICYHSHYALFCILWFPQKQQNNTVRFVFTSSCCLIYVICVCLRIVVSNTSCVVFLICFIVMCTQCRQFLWILHFEWPLRYSLAFIQTDPWTITIYIFNNQNESLVILYTNIFISTTIKQNELIFNVFTNNRISHFEVLKYLTTLIIAANLKKHLTKYNICLTLLMFVCRK